MKVSSATPMVSAKEEFLRRFSDSLVAGGMMRRRAMGIMTERYASTTDSPVETAASSCVLGIDWIPARMTSDIRAPWYTLRPTTADQNSAPWRFSHSWADRGRIWGAPKYQKKSQTSSGTLRKNST